MPQSKPLRPPEEVAPIGCQNCRELHLKCDRVIPVCGRCRSAGRRCSTGFKFKAVKKSFHRNQRWTHTPNQLTYLDETSSIARNYDGSWQSDDEDQGGSRGREVRGPSEGDGSDAPPTRVHVNRQGRNGSPSDRFISTHYDDPPSVSRNALDNRGAYAEPAPAVDQPRREEIESFRAQVYLDKAVWPLRDPAEAVLFRQFIHKLSIWLDLCDPFQSFETIVPQRAGTCPILLNAIFALSARHMSHTTDFDPLASNRYHEQCLKSLIPMMDHAVTMSDENLFAATIILRVLEEMEVRHMGMDTHGYLLGIHAFVHRGDPHLAPGSLSAAAFWVGLRQEIYSAVMNHQPVRIPLAASLVDRSLGATDDYSWSNRAVVHCADVLNFCFGDDARSSPSSRWSELEAWNKGWQSALPSSFIPIYYKERAGDEAFPEIWYQSGCNVIGVQHHLLAELFLACFDPNLPRVGGHRREASKRVMQHIDDLVRRVCGIGICNQWTPPGMFTACMAVAAFGDRFHQLSDQEAFLDLLIKTERDHARPTEAVQRQMKKAWDWPDAEE